MVALENSVSYFNGASFRKTQKIRQFSYERFFEKNYLITESISLCSDKFIFVDIWN